MARLLVAVLGKGTIGKRAWLVQGTSDVSTTPYTSVHIDYPNGSKWPARGSQPPRAVDREAIGDVQLAAGQGDGAGHAEVDRVGAGVGVGGGDRLPERVGAAVEKIE